MFAVVNLATAAVHADALGSPARAKRASGRSKARRLQDAFAAHPRHVGRVYPAASYPRVVLVIDNAPWHRGLAADAALAGNPHLEFYRLPPYGPQLNPAERLWRKLRRRATHNRLSDALRDLKASVRNSIRYFQAVRDRVKAMIGPK